MIIPMVYYKPGYGVRVACLPMFTDLQWSDSRISRLQLCPLQSSYPKDGPEGFGAHGELTGVLMGAHGVDLK